MPVRSMFALRSSMTGTASPRRDGAIKQLSPLAAPGHFEINLDGVGLGDGAYEYEFVLDGDEDAPVADPFAVEITRFGGYRGLFGWRAAFASSNRFHGLTSFPATSSFRGTTSW
jgi:hypothetical protein